MNAQLSELPAVIEPMTARAAAALPEPGRADRYSFELKADGWRAQARHAAGRVQLISRQQRPLTRAFPEIVAALLDQVPEGTVLDGELVVFRGGRFDFTALQRRHHPAAVHAARRGALPAATYMVFDLLFLTGVDLRPEPYDVRRDRLEQLLGDAVPPLICMPATRELAAARAWLHEHTAAGVEGVVVKHRRHGYLPARRRWAKVKVRTTSEAVICGVTGPATRPATLMLGLPRPDGLHITGHTTVLPAAARSELGALLVATAAPGELAGPRGWPGPTSGTYTPVRPDVVVEVETDLCRAGGRWRHPARFVRWRADLTVEDLAVRS